MHPAAAPDCQPTFSPAAEPGTLDGVTNSYLTTALHRTTAGTFRKVKRARARAHDAIFPDMRLHGPAGREKLVRQSAECFAEPETECGMGVDNAV